MSPITYLLPAVEAELTDETDHSHLYCCDSNLALCGVDLSEGEDVDGDEPTDCFACVAIDEAGVPCVARFCRLRSWWRERWPW